MIDQWNRYILKDYGKKTPFADFLPGIAGELGIPLWCFYVNRGQCITCFGVQDKDHSILQFYPAHQAYLHTKRLGFRTFLKKEGTVIECFVNEENPHEMAIGMNELAIREQDLKNKYTIEVEYGTLPEEPVAGLMRKVTFTNLDEKEQTYEILDGVPAVIPYGINLSSITDMGQTCKAWMQTKNEKEGAPVFCVRASTADTARVDEIHGGNISFAYTEKGDSLPVIVDPGVVFSYDTSLSIPYGFQNKSLEELLGQDEITVNTLPCCFYGQSISLKPNESAVFYELFGQAEETELLDEIRAKAKGASYWEMKFLRNRELTKELTKKIRTKTGNTVFDHYCEQTYLDNVLRGGEPVRFGSDQLYYLYSRKHGDMERDYNYFKMLPEFFSQGNGNFRDVNQNRRMDVSFSPYVGRYNIRLFYNAIQADGYNPLGIGPITYSLSEQDAENILDEEIKGLKEFVTKPFTPGKLYQILQAEHQNVTDQTNIRPLFDKVMQKAKGVCNTDFLEGYWSDHWTYNLDLIENYLSIYPEEEESIFFKEEIYTYPQTMKNLLPAQKRYEETERGIRQYHFLEDKDTSQDKDTNQNKHTNQDKEQASKYLCMENDRPYVTTLIGKMILIATVKFAALDFYAMGIQMEGGKPGWYDALNGLPGLLGSSMAETYELARQLKTLLSVLKRNKMEIDIMEELYELLENLQAAVRDNQESLHRDGTQMAFYQAVTNAKESYQKKVSGKISGKTYHYTTLEAAEQMQKLLDVVELGIQKAKGTEDGLYPTYFYYTVTEYEKSGDGITIRNVRQESVPLFLEGIVRYLKWEDSKEAKETVYQKVCKSGLYDSKLRMYKVCDSLENESMEIGRARAFTRGWLENESIWLHMEYKYLLELLKSGLYEEYLNDFGHCLIPFLKEETYGRSLFENVSFIASSVNPDASIHGKGFVARLSGSTVEFMHMWQIMMFGKNPFYRMDGKVVLSFSPLIPAQLITDEGMVTAMFLGSIPVCYHLPERKDYIPGNYQIEKYEIVQAKSAENRIVERESVERGNVEREGEQEETEYRIGITTSIISEPYSLMIREGKANQIDVYLK